MQIAWYRVKFFLICFNYQQSRETRLKQFPYPGQKSGIYQRVVTTDKTEQC